MPNIRLLGSHFDARRQKKGGAAMIRKNPEFVRALTFVLFLAAVALFLKGMGWGIGRACEAASRLIFP